MESSTNELSVSDYQFFITPPLPLTRAADVRLMLWQVKNTLLQSGEECASYIFGVFDAQS